MLEAKIREGNRHRLSYLRWDRCGQAVRAPVKPAATPTEPREYRLWGDCPTRLRIEVLIAGEFRLDEQRIPRYAL